MDEKLIQIDEKWMKMVFFSPMEFMRLSPRDLLSDLAMDLAMKPW